MILPRRVRLILVLLFGVIAGLLSAVAILLWWGSPIPTFLIFTSILHGMLLGACLMWIVTHLEVHRSVHRACIGIVAGVVSVGTLAFGQYVADANAHRRQVETAARTLTPEIEVSTRDRSLAGYDRDVLEPVTGHRGIVGHFLLATRGAPWRRWARGTEALLVIAIATTLSVGASRAPSIATDAKLAGSMPLLRPLIYLWTSPTTAVGLLFVPAALVSGGGMAVVDGVLEVHGGLVSTFLRRCTPLRGGASAMTLGHVVIGRSRDLLDFTRSHERVHVRQAERWGPLFIPAYLFSSVIVYLRGGRAYEDNPFEREAYALDGGGADRM